MILVNGATGNVGGELAAVLAKGGEPVRALVRQPGRSLPGQVEQVTGDLNEPASLRPALQNVRAVFLLSGYADMPGLLDEVRSAGVERVVLMSGSGAGASNTDNAISRYQLSSEEAVRSSGVDWTIVRPCAFMSNALGWRPQLQAGDVVKAPFADVANAVVDPYDIAAVVAVALTANDPAGQIYRVSGPEALKPAGQLHVLAERLRRDLRLEPLSNQAAREQMLATTPPEYADAFFSFYVDGTLDESQVLPTVQEVTGRPPRTFEQWADAHLDAFT